MVQQCVASLMNLACCLAARAQAPTELKGHNALVYSLAFSASGKLLASGSFDNTIKLWEYPSGKELRSLGGHAAPVYCVAFSPDGQFWPRAVRIRPFGSGTWPTENCCASCAVTRVS